MQCFWCPFVAENAVDFALNHLPAAHRNELNRFVFGAVGTFVVVPLIANALADVFGSRPKRSRRR